MHSWNYSGDINLKCGGFFWREDGYDDYVLAVEVVDCSDAEGPENLFIIQKGSIYIGDDKTTIASALDIIGAKPESATREDIVYAIKAYRGLDGPDQTVIRVGPVSPFYDEGRGGMNPKPDTVLRSNVNFREYIVNNFLD